MPTSTSLTAALAVSALLAAPAALAGGGCSSAKAACADAAPPATTVSAAAQPVDIVDTAVAAGKFNTLAAALKAAGLVDTLKGPGPFTVFAPTDEAFAKLPAGTVETLLKPENKDRLVAILTYHVVPGNVPASKAMALNGAATVNGQRIDITSGYGKVKIDEATVISADVKAANGVIHVIDTVLIPSDKDIVETAVAAGSFKTLAAALTAADLVSTLQGEGPFTVFAPTDEAFAKLPPGTLDMLLKPENRQQLVDILTYHVVPGRVYSDAVAGMSSAATVNGANVNIKTSGGKVMLNGANVVKTDIDADNGVIHVIDAVLLPPKR